MRKWIAVYGGLNTLLDIAVIFTTQRKRNVFGYFLYKFFL